MKVGALISGAKDSMYAAYAASKKHELVCLITLIPENVPNLHLVPRQAELIGLPLISIPTSGEKEKELDDLKEAIQIAKDKYKIEAVVSGAIASEYQKSRVDRICKELKLESIAPIWHMNAEQYMQKLVLEGFEVIIAGVAAEGFDETWLGRKIDRNTIADLKKLNIHIAGEGGEYETFVLDCPLFKKKITIVSAEKKMESEYAGVYQIEDIKLVGK
jgi:diphthine-ammonia ligase